MNLPAIPEKHADLISCKKIHREIRQRRRDLESRLREVETALGRLRSRDELELDEVADRLASGEIGEIEASDLPRQQATLRAELEVLVRADQKAAQKLKRERERHNREIVKAYRPLHKQAAQRILRAVEELVEANRIEHQIRQACPVALVNVNFPNIGDFSANNPGSARHWRDYVKRLGFLEPDEPEPKSASKAKRALFARRGNGARVDGVVADAAPLAAKMAD